MSAACLPLMRRVAPLAAVVVALGAGGPPPADRSISNPIGEVFALVFDSEWIWLDIVGDSLEVRGIYVLLCRTPVAESIPLFFPFPKDSLLGGARMVSLAYRTGADPSAPADWEELPGASGVRWWLPPCAGAVLQAWTW